MQGEAPLPTGPLGNTGLAVPVLGLGTTPAGTRLAGGHSTRLFHRAIDLDVTFFDTAPAYGEAHRKLLELAWALMATPRMILLDEPGAGVNPALTRRIVTKIEEMAASGISFLLIEHDMDLVMGCAIPF